MASNGILDPLFTYEGRLATFHSAQPVPKRRTSTANSKAPKTAKWPHPSISPEDLAKAGLYHCPSQVSPDNVACFLCKKNLDGWEEDDDPLAEHHKHAPECGWAVVASMEAPDSELRQEYPLSPTMIEARKATFADKWPHEDKKGWICKTKQLAEAGWKYTPTAEYDDMATCAYCELALDGWEPKDKPLEEHHRRSPDCAFFSLINQHQQSPPAKRTKTKKGRPSKASRLSTQSNFTILSEAEVPSFTDLPAEEDDSILTTATDATMTSRVGKKASKGKKTTAAKGRKTKPRKDEPVELKAAPEPEDADFEVKMDTPPKATRGKKRKSDEMNTTADEIVVNAPEPKRRTTRTRASMAMEVDQPIIEPPVIEPEAPASVDPDSVPAKELLAKKRGRPSGTKATRKTSRTSAATKAAAVEENIPGDEEIDKALEADLEKQVTDDEGAAEISLPKTRKVSRAKPTAAAKKSTRSSVAGNADHAMFETQAMEIDDATIDAELQVLEEELKPLAKAKGAKAKQPRKPSAKQLALAAKKAAEEAEAQAQKEAREAQQAREATVNESPEATAMDIDEQGTLELAPDNIQKANSRKPAARKTRASVLSVNDGNASLLSVQSSTMDFGNDTNASIGSQDIVVRGRTTKKVEPAKKTTAAKKGKKVESTVQEPKGTLESPDPLVEAPEETLKDLDVPNVEREIQEDDIPVVKAAPEPEPEVEEPATKPATKAMKAKTTKAKGKGKAVQESSASGEIPRVETAILPPAPKAKANSSTKRGAAVPAPPSPEPVKETKESTPQSSDAENHPPSSKPSTLKQIAETPQPTSQQIPLAVSTPTTSPSKHNIVPSIATAHPWTAADLEIILLRSPSSAENKQDRTILGEVGQGLERISKGDQALTSPEKNMTVEAWIKHNADLAEEKLRAECERMVGVFEREGGRAMRTLEGIECLE